MADKKLTIGIETTADTSGAKEASSALDQVENKAEDAAKAIDDAGNGSGLKKLPPEAKAAAGSIDALEEEVQGLVRELNRLPVGSQQFADMAAKVRIAERSLADTRKEASKLAGSVGRRGDAGGAVLELSRAFEDAQYGIRGVLNNIPGLIAMLGGSAGLAGVISVVAVAGSILWEKFGSGAKESKKDAEDLTDRLGKMLKVYEDFVAVGKDAREQATQRVADELKRSLGGIDSRFNLIVGADGVESARAAAEASVQLAQDKLTLARTESALITATGTESVRLAAQREEIIKRIYQDEQAIAEINRTAALNKAQAKVDQAGGKASATAETDAQIAAQFQAQKALVEGLRSEADALTATRLSVQKNLIDERTALSLQLMGLKREINDVQSVDAYAGIEAKIDKAELRLDLIAKLLADPQTTEREFSLNQQANAEETVLKDLSAQLKESTEAQRSAAAAMTAAQLELINLRQAQNAQRDGERDLKKIADAGAADTAVQGKKNDMVGQLEGLLGGIGEQGGRDLAPFVSEMKSILQDKAISADELTRIPTLLAQYFGKVANMGAAQNKAIRDAMGKMDELEREVRNLRSAAGSRNP